MSGKKRARAKSPRARRREAERAKERVAELRERLFGTQPASRPDLPEIVSSASVIEPHARALPCPRCEGALRIVEHRAAQAAGRRLREVVVVCQQCGSSRSLWFELAVVN